MEIQVWTINGVPARLVWDGRRYRVNDTPTRLSPEEIFERTWHPAMTHPLPGWIGWRFQAVGPDHLALMFEVREGRESAPWQLLRAFDYDGVKASTEAHGQGRALRGRE
ncbi:hypothetical protein [Mesorhizobium japonicum]|uniref:hypothetical protein n=1 Tax=Mesorhizobium japonicum TaxID=2066070 RepID=UPI003B5B2DC0